jgi:hypothetical protein
VHVPAKLLTATVAAVAVSGGAMLAGARPGMPAGPPAGVAPPPAARAGPAPAPPPGDGARPARAMPVEPSVSVSGTLSATVSATASVPGSPAPGASGPPPVTGSPVPSGSAVWSAVNCAEVRIRFAGGPPTDAGGPLVPFGATSVTRCETPLTTAGTDGTGSAVALPKVLTTGVDRVTAILNALPTIPADQACLPITMPVQVSLVFTLPEQFPLAVIVDPTCSALIAGDRARSYTMLNPLTVFDALYAAQPGVTSPPPPRPAPA